jgi:hypothetical protein
MPRTSAHIVLKKSGTEQVILHGSAESTRIFALIENVGEIGAEVKTDVAANSGVIDPHSARFFFLEKGPVKAKLAASATGANDYTVLHVHYFFPGDQGHCCDHYDQPPSHP